MATLVGAFGSSHSPALNSPAEDFAGHARRDEQFLHHLDREGRRATYEQLVRSAPAGIDKQITPEKIAQRVAACERHIDRLAGAIAQARLDALIVVGDDQKEQYFEDNMPAFLVYCGKSIVNGVLDLPAGAPEYWKRARSQYFEPDAPREYPAAADLALHMVRSLVDSDFDVSYAQSLPRPRGEGHAGVETWREHARVGILASGGLSHFTIDEALDRAVLEACRNADEATLSALPPAKLDSGNSEIRNWIVAAGAAAGLKMLWQEYVPLYRTPAGTGCGMAFAAWGEK